MPHFRDLISAVHFREFLKSQTLPNGQPQYPPEDVEHYVLKLPGFLGKASSNMTPRGVNKVKADARKAGLDPRLAEQQYRESRPSPPAAPKKRRYTLRGSVPLSVSLPCPPQPFPGPAGPQSAGPSSHILRPVPVRLPAPSTSAPRPLGPGPSAPTAGPSQTDLIELGPGPSAPANVTPHFQHPGLEMWQGVNEDDLLPLH